MITYGLYGDANSCGSGCFLSIFRGKIRTKVTLLWVGLFFPIMFSIKIRQSKYVGFVTFYNWRMKHCDTH